MRDRSGAYLCHETLAAWHRTMYRWHRVEEGRGLRCGGGCISRSGRTAPDGAHGYGVEVGDIRAAFAHNQRRMHVSARSDYAVRALVELAAAGSRPIKREHLASSQHIPIKFLGNILQ